MKDYKAVQVELKGSIKGYSHETMIKFNQVLTDYANQGWYVKDINYKDIENDRTRENFKIIRIALIVFER